MLDIQNKTKFLPLPQTAGVSVTLRTAKTVNLSSAASSSCSSLFPVAAFINF